MIQTVPVPYRYVDDSDSTVSCTVQGSKHLPEDPLLMHVRVRNTSPMYPLSAVTTIKPHLERANISSESTM
jgi:hypothetical protein